MAIYNPNTPPTTGVIYGTEGADTLYGTDYADTIYGRGGNDYITGGFGNDWLFGEAGNDTLNGGGGDDYLDGGAGNDLMFGDTGADTFIGGAGTDTVSYQNAWAVGVTVDLTYGTRAGEAVGDNFSGIEKFVGSNYNDYFVGDATANTFEGGAGNDTLSGNDGDDILIGGNGDDYLYGGTGADFIDGYAGFDIASYAWSSQAVTVDLTSGSRSGDAIGDTFRGIEKFVGTNYGDIFNGDAYANTFEGGNGEDWLFGQGGNDTLYGGLGDDVIRGGNGDDYIVGSLGQDQLSGDGPGSSFNGYDKFVIGPNTGADVITDFQHGVDKIVLSGFDYGSDGTPFGSDGYLAQGYYDQDGNLAAAYLREGDELFFNTATEQLYKIDPVYINGEVANLNAELLVTFANNVGVGTSDFMF